MRRFNKTLKRIIFACIFCLSLTIFQGFAQSNLSLVNYQKKDNYFTITCKKENTQQEYSIGISFPYEDAVNFSARPSRLKPLQESETKCDFILHEQKNTFTLLTEFIKVKINKAEMLFTIENVNTPIFKGYLKITPHPEHKEDVITLCNAITSDEKFYGFGERLDGFNQKGNKIVMELGDCWCRGEDCSYKSIPFYYSSRSYALLVNSPNRFIFDVGNQQPDQMQIISPDMQMNFYLFAGQSPITIMNQYTKITGRSPDIPNWTLEPWISRRSMTGWDNPQTVKREIDAMNEYGMHIGVVLWEGISRHFGKHQNPSTSDMVNYFHSQNIKVISWDNTGHMVDNQRNRERYGYTNPDIKKFFVQDKNGNLFQVTRGGEVYNPDAGGSPHIYIDVTNPEAMDWWLNNVLSQRILGDNGKSTANFFNLDGIKLDFSESFPYDTSLFNMKNPNLGMENAYSVLYGKQVYDWLQKHKPDGGIVWQRGGGLGLQTVGPVWNGDRVRNYTQLQGTLESLLSASVSGIALAGQDLGGYVTGDDPYAQEAYIRGVQFATFSPFFHDHGSAQAPWEQTRYGMENYAFYTHVRYNLMPYLQQLVDEAHQTGIPMMRPLFFYHPRDVHAWDIADAYYFGSNLLVAPFTHTGNIRKIYLPEGEWIDFWNNTQYTGGQTIMYNSPLNRIPVFVKKRTILPLALNKELSIGGNFKHSDKNNLLLTFEIYTQSPQSTSYRNNDENIDIDFSANDTLTRISVNGISQNIGFIVHCNIPDYITVLDKEIERLNQEQFSKVRQGWTYDYTNKELKLKVAEQPNNKHLTCKIIGKDLMKAIYLSGSPICEIPTPTIPKIITTTEWNESIDISFERNEDLSATYVLDYDFVKQIVHPSGLGENITITGLEKNKYYTFRLWEENQFGTSIETPRVIVKLDSQKSPVFDFKTDYIFIQANHFTTKQQMSNDSVQYIYKINNTDKPCTIKLWAKIERNDGIHYQYPRWYPLDTVQLIKGENDITVSVPEYYDVIKIYLSKKPEEWPFFKDSNDCSYYNVK